MTQENDGLPGLVERMMASGMGAGIVRAGLVAGGWQRKNVDAAKG